VGREGRREVKLGEKAGNKVGRKNALGGVMGYEGGKSYKGEREKIQQWEKEVRREVGREGRREVKKWWGSREWGKGKEIGGGIVGNEREKS
jgi:hypothetical protein